MGFLSGLFGGSKTGPARVRVLPADIGFEVGPKQTILQAALDQGYAYPHNCRVGSCGTCKTRLVSGQVRELTDKSYLLSDAEMAAGVILACQSVPRGDLVLENIGLVSGGLRHAVVATGASIAALDRQTGDIMRLALDLAEPISYTAGQYAELARDGEPARQFSFIDAPGEGGTRRVRFFIRHVPGGEFSSWLFGAAKPGDALSLRAPFGDFYLRPSTAPILAIAGGSGLGPVLALLEQARRDRVSRDATLIFGVRTEADLYALDMIAALARGWIAQFRFIPVVSAEPDGSGWAGARGFIHTHLGAMDRAAVAASHAYLCGPTVMIDAAIPVLSAAGIDRAEIRYDAFTDRSTLTLTDIYVNN